MTEVLFILKDGGTEAVDIADGLSVMQGAVLNDVPGINGECGGACACATCHVLIEQAPAGADLPAMSEQEDGLLNGTASPRTAASRLACQIIVGPALAGLVVRVPDTQV